MLTTTQVRNLQTLHDALATQTDVGPIDAPRVGERYHCGGGRLYWMRDVSTVQFATRLAVETDPRCRRRRRVLSIRMGRRLNALVEHYGLTAEQIQTIIEIDDLPIPDADHGGRQVWLLRQQRHIREVIAQGTATAPPPAYVNNMEPAEDLLVTSERHSEELAPVR